MMRLVVEQGKLAGHGFDLERSVIVIGRGADCDIVLDEHQVSRQHARLLQTPQGWMLTDLGSTNGTQVNGQPLRPHEPVTLQPGDRVSLGACVLALRAPAAVPEIAGPQESRPGKRPGPALMIVGAIFIAVLLVGIVAGLVVLLQDKEEEAAPGGGSPLEGLDEVIEIPTLIEGITTALPIPTQLEELATAMPIPTDLEEAATSLPVPTQLQELVTALPELPELPELPMLPPATPPPLVGAALSGAPAQAISQGAGQ